MSARAKIFRAICPRKRGEDLSGAFRSLYGPISFHNPGERETFGAGWGFLGYKKGVHPLYLIQVHPTSSHPQFSHAISQ